MKRSFKATPSTKVTAATEEKSRVVAIQFDVELAPGTSSEDFINYVNEFISNDSVSNPFYVQGAEFSDDLTDIYEKQYEDCLVFRDNDEE